MQPDAAQSERRLHLEAALLVGTFVMVILAGVALMAWHSWAAAMVFVAVPFCAGVWQATYSGTALGTQVQHELTATGHRVGRVLHVLGVALLPAIGVVATGLVTQASSAAVRLSGLVVLTLLLGSLTLKISTTARRERLSKRLASLGWAAPLVYSAIVIFLASGVFTGITNELSNHHLVRLHPQPSDSGQIFGFYLWELLDKLPGDVPDTLRWRAPLTYDDGRVGALVLLLTVGVIAPSVACARGVHVQRRKSEAAGDIEVGTTEATPQ